MLEIAITDNRLTKKISKFLKSDTKSRTKILTFPNLSDFQEFDWTVEKLKEKLSFELNFKVEKLLVLKDGKKLVEIALDEKQSSIILFRDYLMEVDEGSEIAIYCS